MKLRYAWLSMAVVALGAPAQPAAAQARLQDVVCESVGNRFKECPVQTGGYAQLVQNISSTRCEFERTWGFDDEGIWVDQGCRGRFRIGGSGGTGWQSGNYGRRIVCESRNSQYQFCEAPTRGDVRLARQLSSEPCVAGRSWGFEQNGIWVNNGCRAEFEIGYSNVNWVGGNRTVVCESRDGQYSRCRVWTYGDVRLTRQLSSTRCTQNRNWGSDENGIWVTGGCRAEFTVGAGGGGWGPGNPGGAGGPATGVEAQARSVCQGKARTMGFSSVTPSSSLHKGSMVRVEMRGVSQGRQYNLECTYRISQRTATITRQTEVGYGEVGDGGGVGGNQSQLYARAGRECTAEARRQGYEILGTGPSQIEKYGVQHTMALRRGGSTYNQAKCNYLTSTGRASIIPGDTGAGVLPAETGGDQGGNDSELARRAAQRCAEEARRQGYVVTGMGTSRAEAWGVRYTMALRRAGQGYPNAVCNYQSRDDRATISVGQTGELPPPRPEPR